MSYCTYDDVETRLGADELAALADYDGDGSADPEVVEQAIRSAGALVDSYLGVRFAVPVALPGGGCPEVLTTRAVNLAVYFLRLGRDSVTEDARAQYEDDVAWLREVVAGTVSLGVEPAPSGGAGAPGARWEGQPRIFGRDEPL
jgi:phage gp36-like protein